MAEASAEEVLVATARAGAFKAGGFDQGTFERFVENKLNLSSMRAINLLVSSGLVIFSLDPDPTIHIRERNEYWLLSLTEAGAALIAASN